MAEEVKQTKKLLIITGPQGSGNHLFSKIFAMHPVVEGWVMNDYWEGHHMEPFARWWDDPSKLTDVKWTDRENYVTSISCPYFYDGKPQIPKYKEFIEEAQKIFDIKIAIIGRDKNILKYQQERIREGHTTSQALEQFKFLWQYKPYFLSTELFFLYGQQYLKRVGEDLDFPVAYNHATRLEDLLRKDSNKKYVQSVGEQPLDKDVYKACDES